MSIGKALSIEELLDIAFNNSPILKSQYHRMNAAKESYKKESIFKNNPVLSFSYSNVPLSDWPSLNKHAMSGFSIGISQYIATPWEDTSRKMALYNKYLSDKEALGEAKNLLAFQIQSTYHNIFFLHKKREILNKNRKVFQDISKLAEALVSVNKMNSSQLLKLKADIFIINNKIIELDGEISNSQTSMEKLCGLTIDWNITDESKNRWIDTENAKDIPIKFNVKEHPLYKKIFAQYKSQVAVFQLEKAKLNPGITLGLDYRIRQEIPGKSEGDDFISLKASSPIPLFYACKDRHSIKAAEEKENESREVLRTIEIDLKSKWKGASIIHSKLLISFLSYEREVLPGYWSAYLAQLASLSAGTLNLLDVLDTYRLYLNASLEHARIYRDLMISKLKLNYLLNNFLGKNP